MTKAEIISEVAMATGRDRRDVTHVVETLVKTINKAMVENKPVYIRGFGTFINVKRKEKPGRNISTNTKMTIPAHYLPKFTFCKAMKKKVREKVK
jgi:DNA-binding protein HU-beta